MSHFTGNIDVMAWITEQTSPVCAEQITLEAATASFHYDTNYLSQQNAMSLYGIDMGNRSGSVEGMPSMGMGARLFLVDL